MPLIALLGLQWGDEGKGKICDILSEGADIIVRHIGGNNAGHTVVINDRKLVLRIIPAGILRPGKLCLLGGGMVVDLNRFYEEIEFLRSLGYEVSPNNLKISPRIHVITPIQKELERRIEDVLGNGAIGTTMRGIGPTYADKALRVGIRIGDLLDSDLERRLKVVCDIHKIENIDVSEVADTLKSHIGWLEPFVEEPASIIRSNLNTANILLEGAHGSLLVDPRCISKTIGVFKAYQTRVGNGPFPTEQSGEVVEYLRKRGNEYGSTTGRPRRCGWLDLSLLRFAAKINSVDYLVVTKVDVLSGLSRYYISDKYVLNGSELKEIEPYNMHIGNVVPNYMEFQGFNLEKTSNLEWKDLDKGVLKYIEYIEKEVGT
ncbi:MAG: hypothetical protein B6D57_01615 [Candidatus Coatesbacteria bacterium 4484_99]|uniref:Adenylosuccinate synthetase n=1 Tax=Candidatus Coatesbacteria bacterium 4484_99 TaxID=1970774 RepID=A0A1W9S271_9BACT|nr:MAG: hypothetical protein B6D57_01615 [Candidatus Coatesbacteria bacterium 4484_99]